MGQVVFDVSEEVPVEDEWTVVPLVYGDDEPAMTAVVAMHEFDVVDVVAMLEVVAVQVEGERLPQWSRKKEW